MCAIPVDHIWSLPLLLFQRLQYNFASLPRILYSAPVCAHTSLAIKSSAPGALAGGYDERVVENKEHYLELRALAESLGLRDHTTFLRSFTDAEKVALLSACTALLYTPSNEHFGICPLEAMYMQRPVVAVSSGGPLETVIDGKTGFLCEPTPEMFAEKMAHFVRSPRARQKLGKAGRQRVCGSFSFPAFTHKLNAIITQLAG